MDVITTPEKIYALASGWKQSGLKVAVVPTMGCLHDGHLSLMRIAGQRGDRVIVTLFVNPLQFGPNEDLDAYPKQFQIDCELAEKEGVDAVFAPENSAMYDESFQTTVNVNRLSEGMCGGDRPDHFSGVATVVTKLFNLTVPDIAVFGEKDFQQLAIIRQLVRDLNFPIEIIGGPIIREADGLAMSSRNTYLKGAGRKTATCLYNSILAARKTVAESTESVASDLIIALAGNIVSEAGAKLEYAVVVNENSLKPEKLVTPESVLALAAKIDGKVRLIDNGKLLI
ncbi:MAG: pantoate--beta-alanine ligase [Desulforhopalus sp.]